MSTTSTSETKPAAPPVEQFRIKVHGRHIQVPTLIPDWQNACGIAPGDGSAKSITK